MMPPFFSFIGGVAIFILGMEFAKEGLTSASGEKLRQLVARTTSSRIKGLLAGIVATALLQSSTATTVILVSLASTGLIGLAGAVAVILGADIGTTITVQILAFPIKEWGLVVMACAYSVRLVVRRGAIRAVSEALMGFGLLFFGMKLMGDGAEPLKDMEYVQSALEASPLLAIVVSAVVTALIHASAATIGIAISLVQGGAISLHAAIPIVLGANIGTSMTALLASLVAKPEGKRVAIAHVMTKIVAVLIFLPLIFVLEKGAETIGGSPGRQVANAHFIFNLATAFILLPFSEWIAKTIERLFPFVPKEGVFGPAYLDKGALSEPSIALANVTRELFRMAEIVERMLAMVPDAVLKGDETAIDRLEEEDAKVNLLDTEIKFYLAKVPKRLMGDRLETETLFLFSVSNDLEEAGDVLSKNLVALARKKRRLACEFSTEGANEIREFHALVLQNLKLAMSAFATKDSTIAQKVIEEKRKLRSIFEQLEQRHVERLAKGVAATFESASLHMNILGHLSRVNSIVSSVAYRLAK
jgi:phosphate:Na+ symporter